MEILERENSWAFGLLKLPGCPALSRRSRQFAVAIILAITVWLCAGRLQASVPSPGGGSPGIMLDAWPLSDTNWLSISNYAPMAFTNLVSVPGLAANALQ